MGSNYQEKVIISLGGSLIVPQEGIDTKFLTTFNTILRDQLAKHRNRQFFLVVGGGTTARLYRDAGRDVVGHELSRDDLDWLGVHSSRLNAQLIRTIFKDVAHPYIIKHYEIIRKVSEQLVVAAGWKPGWSTDYCAVLLCEDYGVKSIINMSNIDQVYNKDPREHSDAKPLDHLSWPEFRSLVGDEWSPGMNAPFDPVAAKKSEELGVKVVVINGHNFENLEKCLEGEEFNGTIIQ